MSHVKRLRRLYGIADSVELARALCAGGASAVQLRLQQASDAEIVQAGRAVAAVCRAAGALFLVNDRADLAVLCEADGVHLGQDDLPAQAARAIVGPARLVGVSTHSPAQARAAEAAGADYLGFGPVFPTTTKADAQPVQGLEALAEVARAAGVPVVAIGGITVERAAQVFRTGAAAAAVISDIAGAADPEARARAFVRAWSGG